ncbi:MAG: peroxidase-related enzyme [Cyanobacteria bacterium P01_A01_bin.40]
MPFFQQQNVLEIFQQNISRYSPFAQFVQNVMRGESAFTAGERELIAAYVSGLNSCDYCYGSHQAIAADLNVDPQLLEAILKDIATAPIEERLRPVFSLVQKLTLTPSKITQDDIDKVLKAGWDEQAVEDAIAVCSLFNFMNRLVNGFGLEQPDQEQLAGMAKMVNSQGYQAIVQSAK